MLRSRINVAPRISSNLVKITQRHLSTSPPLSISQVKQLPNWDLQAFKQDAFNACIPVKLPRTAENLPPACNKWFIHDGNASNPIDINNPPTSSELRTSFWSDHEQTIVPLELTSKLPPSPSPSPSSSSSSPIPETTFTRSHAPLKFLLTYLTTPKPPFSTATPLPPTHSIYLAQCSLPSLPPSLNHDLPTPSLVLHSGKGDIYASSLWMGKSPTYTPLHRDPNPNLFLQLAGQKVVRLLPPEIGNAVFDLVQEKVGGRGASAAFRGEEMMAGPEREVLRRVVWEDQDESEGGEGGGLVGRFACEARLGLGEALFIPKGWWHSVLGVGEGVTASVNWWFR